MEKIFKCHLLTRVSHLNVSVLLDSNNGSIRPVQIYSNSSFLSSGIHHSILVEFAYVFTFCEEEKEWQPYSKNDKFITRTLSSISYHFSRTCPLYGWVEPELLH